MPYQVSKWTYCSVCEATTAHVPKLANWGSASGKCTECGWESFIDYHDIKCEMTKLLE